MSVLVVAEHLRGQVRDVTFELIAAGRELELLVKWWGPEGYDVPAHAAAAH